MLIRNAYAVVIALAILFVGGCGLDGTPTAPNGVSGIVATIVEPDDGVKPITDFIGQAKNTVDVGVYLLSDRNVLDALKEARQRGVKVRVMLEDHPFGGGQGNATVYKQLDQAGIQVKWGNPTFRYTHEKVIIVDRKYVAIMTLNLTRSAFTRNREFAVIVDSPGVVADVQGVFEADWERRAFKPGDPNLVVSPDNSRTKLLDLIAKAQRSLDIYAEEMQERTIEDALISAAKRGVKVRVIMSPADSGEKDSNERGRANIKSGGVGVRLVTKPYIHAKIVLVDRQKAFVGSQNFSRTSLDLNREIGLIVSDSGSLQRIQAVFEKDWTAGKVE